MATPERSRVRAQRLAVFAAVLAGLLAAAWLAGPRLTAFTTNAYADTRAVFGVPNFQNVASNLAFLLAGIAGLALCAHRPRLPARLAWSTFYAGMVLTACGSAWHHLTPSAASIVWDRLGMVVAFVGLLAGVVEASTGLTIGVALLAAAVLLGMASVLWWRVSGDLGVYAFVQLAPLAAVVTALSLNWITGAMRRALLVSLACYVLAKLAESFDAGIYCGTAHLVSGHTLKHLLAAAAALAILGAQARTSAADT
jgi:hypothetical protein